MTRSPAAVQVHRLVRPARLTGPGGAEFRAAADVVSRVRRNEWGDDDHTESVDEQYALAADTPTEHWRGWTARTGDGQVVGLLSATLPQRENPTVAWIDVAVDPAHRRRGIGSALLAAAEEQLRDAGRTVLAGWSETPATGSAPDDLAARSGAGALPATIPVVPFARRHGFELEQVERLGRLDVPVPPGTLDALAAALPGHPGYELTGWVDDGTGEEAADYGRLKAAMSTDIPAADLDLEAEAWDEARVAEEVGELIARGGHRLVAAVRHTASGRLVGHTVLERFDARPAVAYQEDTLVLAAHRGHRLGILLKIENLRRLPGTWPDVRRVYTWNAEENTPVLDINVRLGFRQVGVVGAWQKHLP